MNQNTGLTRLVKAFGYSIAGFKAAWINEQAFRQEVLLCIVLIPLAFWLGDSGVERALLISCLLLVLITELFNSAIEAVADRISQEKHPLIGRAKDIGSAAVFIALCYTVLVWGLVLWP
ncbi:MAG: diacylglycerol kinase [Candidatus Parabeggiatoa sp. nov. 2]|nr:MAG: diacylglycerol kinase [Beggiatoa sp. 4572_84]RKZ56695.1 MAG: diacylglycerol kinase [Gammaproteobacteria bacterium]HEC86228.1 diacylglycerol kinase [Thioploca sp.]